MNELPNDLKYRETHEWVRLEGDGICTVGITDHAQEMLGDMVFVELPKPGAELTAGAECAVAESVKAASDIYAPVSGEVVEVNTALEASPELINSDPYTAGWLLRIRISNESELSQLMDAQTYQDLVDE